MMLSVSLHYSHNYPSAIAGSDYTSVSMVVVFPTGTSDGDIQCIGVQISSDGAVEGDETFIVTLNASTRFAILGNAMTTIAILDTDSN